MLKGVWRFGRLVFPFVRTDLTRSLGPLHEIWKASYKAPPGTGIRGGGLELFIPHHIHHHGFTMDSFQRGTSKFWKRDFFSYSLAEGTGFVPFKNCMQKRRSLSFAGLIMERMSPTSLQPLPDIATASKSPCQVAWTEQLRNIAPFERNSLPRFAVPIFHCFLAGWGC